MYIINKEVTMKDGTVKKYPQTKVKDGCPLKYVNKRVAERLATELTEICGEDVFAEDGEVSSVFKIEDIGR